MLIRIVGLLLVGVALGAAMYWFAFRWRADHPMLEPSPGSAVAPSSESVVLGIASPTKWDLVAWGGRVGLVVLAYMVDPGPLRRRWLSLPLAQGATLLGAVPMLWAGWPRPSGRLSVSPHGWQCSVDRREDGLHWSDVRRVVRLTTGNFKAGGATMTTLVVIDREGKPYLSEVAPVQLAEAWERLLASVHAWGGRPIEHRRGLY